MRALDHAVQEGDQHVAQYTHNRTNVKRADAAGASVSFVQRTDAAHSGFQIA